MYANDLFVCVIKFLEILINVFLEEAKFEETKVKVLKWTSNNIPPLVENKSRGDGK